MKLSTIRPQGGGASINTWNVTPTIIPGEIDDPVILENTSQLVIGQDGAISSNFGSSAGPGSIDLGIGTTSFTFAPEAGEAYRYGIELSSATFPAGSVLTMGFVNEELSATDVRSSIISNFNASTSGEPLLAYGSIYNLAGNLTLTLTIDSGGNLSNETVSIPSFEQGQKLVFYFSSSSVTEELHLGVALYSSSGQLINTIATYEGGPISSLSSSTFRLFVGVGGIDFGSGSFSPVSGILDATAGDETLDTSGTDWDDGGYSQQEFDDRFSALQTCQAITPEQIIEADLPTLAANKFFRVTGAGPRDGQVMSIGDIIYFDTDTTFSNLSSGVSGTITMGPTPVIPSNAALKLFSISGSGTLLGTPVSNGNLVLFNANASAITNLSSSGSQQAGILANFNISLSSFALKYNGPINTGEQDRLPTSSRSKILLTNNLWGGNNSLIYELEANGAYVGHFTTQQPIFAPGSDGFIFKGSVLNQNVPTSYGLNYSSILAMAAPSYQDAPTLKAAYESNSLTDFAIVVEFSFDGVSGELTLRITYKSEDAEPQVVEKTLDSYLYGATFCMALDRKARQFSLAFIHANWQYMFTHLTVDLSPAVDGQSFIDNPPVFYFIQDYQREYSGIPQGVVQRISSEGYAYDGSLSDFSGYNDIFYKLVPTLKELLTPDLEGKLIRYQDFGFGEEDPYIPVLSAEQKTYAKLDMFGERVQRSYLGWQSPHYRVKAIEMIDIERPYLYTGADIVPLDGRRILGIIETPFHRDNYLYDYDFLGTETAQWPIYDYQTVYGLTNFSYNCEDSSLTIDNSVPSLLTVEVDPFSGTTAGYSSSGVRYNFYTEMLWYESATARQNVLEEGEISSRIEIPVDFHFPAVTEDVDDVQHFVLVYNQGEITDPAELIKDIAETGYSIHPEGPYICFKIAKSPSEPGFIRVYGIQGGSGQFSINVGPQGDSLLGQYFHMFKERQSDGTDVVNLQYLGNHAQSLVQAEFNYYTVGSSDLGNNYAVFVGTVTKQQFDDSWPQASLKLHAGASKPPARKPYYRVGQDAYPYMPKKLIENTSNMDNYLTSGMIPVPTLNGNLTKVYNGMTPLEFDTKFLRPSRIFDVVYLSSFPNWSGKYGQYEESQVSSVYKAAGGRIPCKLYSGESEITVGAYNSPVSLAGTTPRDTKYGEYSYEGIRTSEGNSIIDTISEIVARPNEEVTLSGPTYLTIELGRLANQTYTVTPGADLNISVSTTTGDRVYEQLVFIVDGGVASSISWLTSINWQEGSPPVFPNSGTTILKFFYNGGETFGKIEYMPQT